MIKLSIRSTQVDTLKKLPQKATSQHKNDFSSMTIQHDNYTKSLHSP